MSDSIVPPAENSRALTPVGVRARGRVENLDSLLAAIENQLREAEDKEDVNVRVRDVLEAVGRRSYGPLLLAIGIFSISPATIVPGLTWASAVLAGLISGQMALGRRFPWLPKQILEASAPRRPLLKFIGGARPWARGIDRFIRPRFTFLAAPPLVNLIALLCVFAALVTIPLGFVPFAPMAPGIAIIMFGLGMTAKDGIVLTLGVAFVAAAVALLSEISDRLAGFWPF
jgi:hypothetical protein